jgi:hypothetical protein
MIDAKQEWLIGVVEAAKRDVVAANFDPIEVREAAEGLFVRFCEFDIINPMEFEGEPDRPWPLPESMIALLIEEWFE